MSLKRYSYEIEIMTNKKQQQQIDSAWRRRHGRGTGEAEIRFFISFHRKQI